MVLVLLNLVLVLIKSGTSDESTQRGRGARLRIGYISRRFHDYPGTQLMARIFGTHDRRRVTVSAYATGPDDPTGHYRGIVRNASDLFVDAAALTSGRGDGCADCEARLGRVD